MASSVFVNPGGSSGGAATLPTAPLGQVLISQGAGIPPVFSSNILLSNLSAPVNQKSWSVYVDSGGGLRFHGVDDVGAFKTVIGVIEPIYGGVGSTYGGIAGVRGLSGVNLGFTPITLAQAASWTTVGNLVNITDSTINTPDAVVVGGGALNVLARWNGTNWKVIQ